MKFRLHIGIATAFTLTTLALIGGIVSVLYFSNSRLAIHTASRAMDRSTEDVMRSFEALLKPVAQVIESSAHLVQTGGVDLRKVQGLHFFFKQIATLPQVYGLFIGFESDGAFYQVVRVLEGSDSFGPRGAKPNPETRFAIRILDDSPGYMADSYIYLADWGIVTGVERGQPQYDPRTRPWYKAGGEGGRLAISEPYIFSSTGKPGLTVSRRAVAGSGNPIGTVGADITLDDLSAYLNQRKVGSRGRIFVLDGAGKVIVQSEGMAGQSAGSEGLLSDTVVANAIKYYRDTGEKRFTLPGSIPVMASFKPFPDAFQKSWAIGVVADGNEFVSDIRRTTLIVLLAAFLVACLAVISISLLSKRLTGPLRRVVKETERIRDFRLDKAFTLRSSVTEINDLVGAVGLMKNSLRSFGAYVPTDLVRSMVSSGTAVKVGGEQRELTLMFTDIASFTRKSEQLPPGQIFSELSAYFSAVTDAIRRHNGTVDKFIGDAVMAFWNAPQADPDHAINACRAALACQAECDILNSKMASEKDQNLFPLATRFGLHCGDVMVGNVGSEERMQYTALGATVNLASRVEAINTRYGTNLLITETLAQRVSGMFLFRIIDVIAPVGVSHPIAVYELLGEINEESDFPASPKQLEMCEAWQDCMAVYEKRDWDQTVAVFEAFLADYPDDRPAKYYLDRCREFVRQPPAPDWDGVTVYDSK